jgi:hypothetical protein
MFQVHTIVPTHDFRDAIVGSRAVAHPYTFVTVEGARAVAKLLNRDADDTHSVVRPVGMSPFFNGPHEFFRQEAQAERYGRCYVSFDDIPF